MPLVLDGDFEAPLKPITDYPTPLGDYLSAKAGEAAQSITDRWNYVAGARPGNTIIGYDGDGVPMYGDDPSQTRVPADVAQAQLDAAGAKMQAPESGMYRDVLDGLVQRQQEKTAREVAISASPTGLRSVAGFGVQAGVSMLDPINLATAFVPVIGPAKYTALLAEAGGMAARTGIRLGIGAAEGAVGTALVQPLDYLVARNVGDDFTMTTALENVAFGAAFGAGLHSIGGAAKDLVFGAPAKVALETDVPARLPESVSPDVLRTAPKPLVIHLETGDVPISPMGAAWMNNSVSHETRIAATSTAVSQLLDGRGVTVEPIIRADPALQLQMAARQQPADMTQALAQAADDVKPQLRAELSAQAANRAEPGAVAEMRAQLGRLQQELDAMGEAPPKSDIRALQQSEKLKFGEAEKRAQAEHDARRGELQDQAERLQQQLDTNARASEAEKDLATLERGEVPERYQDQVQQRAEQLLQGDPIQAAVRRQFAPSEEADRAAVQRFNAAENVAVADSEMARAADTRLAETPEPVRNATTEGAEQSMKDAQVKFEETVSELQRTGATERTIASLRDALAAFEADVKDAAALAKGLMNAALCGVMR
ncbi:hypothetical protein ACUXAV_000383 [Cupriavidus metallidurans]|uniref:hypothetical protein n=1 Tax=Cupriavidus metallidurans TaxID=119219 RepID=UPI000492FEC2|nr:hypothetical protein [Cupriavidus metallidurans]MDE4918343.1 hypothetical protein [Cupriavidus metallidurans]